MSRQYFLLSTALLAWLGISGCGESARQRPAPVLNLGLHADSASGAMIVGERDTLWDIAKRYRLPVRGIIDLNGLEPPYALARGQRLKLPPPMEYRAHYRDTLYSIANMFGVGVYRLAQVNNLHEPYSVSPGQNLRIPSAHFAMPPPASARAGSGRRTAFIQAPATQALPDPALRRGGVVLNQFIWPVRGRVISGYGPTGDGLYNEGINIAAARGAPVAAAAAGEVAYVGDDLKSYGNLVLIRHAGGAMTAYAHLDSVSVRKGMFVREGQPIGTVGSTGAVSASQLHFEIRQGSKTRDPRQYLG